MKVALRNVSKMSLKEAADAQLLLPLGRRLLKRWRHKWRDKFNQIRIWVIRIVTQSTELNV